MAYLVDDFSKFRSSTFDVLHFKNSSNMAKIWQKNEEKPCSTCLLVIFRLIPGTPKSDFILSLSVFRSFLQIHSILKKKFDYLKLHFFYRIFEHCVAWYLFSDMWQIRKYEFKWSIKMTINQIISSNRRDISPRKPKIFVMMWKFLRKR